MKSGDTVYYQDNKYIVGGVHNDMIALIVNGKKSVHVIVVPESACRKYESRIKILIQ